MKIVGPKNPAADNSSELDLSWEASASEAPIVQTSYHEMADRPVVGVDALTQLENNVRTLVEMQGRFSFILREVTYLLKG